MLISLARPAPLPRPPKPKPLPPQPQKQRIKSSQMNQEPSPLPNPLLPFIARRTFGSTPLCWSKGAIKLIIPPLLPEPSGLKT
ncbi:hypothetical protein DW916_07155 [Segatella copri]|uniref:Uncharacterized protein n=1 Tax=Segatella copri TaxID=165179 RepID=A0A3R6HU43_9BACT|nr:hypothetical protein [Segatella copri]RHA86956.1 hypothetical protein DW916_07155 [Segatella copri]RHH85357.1 hypothetical protein DW192_01095 [Segatella copri]